MPPMPKRPTKAPRKPKPKKSPSSSYSAKDIEVLEGLEPVRRRPGMYVGGTDETAMHHLAAEVLDNAMDEAVAGFASRIEIEMAADGNLTVRDNGRGVPVDPHPKFKKKSALEVILTTLHSGGKFGGKVYETAGGLHGVGVSVVNALSDSLAIEVVRDGKLWCQEYVRGAPKTKLKAKGQAKNRRGTTIRFHPDPDIFGPKMTFQPDRLYRMARSKAYLFRGVEIRWACAEKLLKGTKVPAKETFHFPEGLKGFLEMTLGERDVITPTPFTDKADFPNGAGRAEWAISWPEDGEGFIHSYCNTVPTPKGGTHEAGLRTALARALKAYGELVGNKRAAQITGEDIVAGAAVMLSIFMNNPEFQGQTKERLSSSEAQRLTEVTLKDHFDHWLSGDPETASALLERIVERAEERLRRREAKDVARKAPTRKLRLPGKLTDCSLSGSKGTELFLVEGDSAGGSAKQARNRDTQAVLPLRGKILNVASASDEKLRGNQEIADLAQALGCGTGPQCDPAKLRYERIIIMTDADVDGAHIASLLMTFFFREMPALVEAGRLYLAVPPLYRLSQGSDTVYARDDAHKDQLLKTHFKGRAKVEISRFKGLGEMPATQLKETTMDPQKRTLYRVVLPAKAERKQVKAVENLVEDLMGRKPERRFAYIQENATLVENLDI
ncbi:MAG: DNA topoisomerase IV subunit B [Alphaproteobacteria bacterium]|nr:DNA topoisomerase IV subunit B [Alphaproteobacteria bacterium]